VKTLIIKLLSNTITDKELVQLHTLLKDKDNQLILEAYVRDYHDLNLAMIKNNVDEAYKKVMGRIEDREKSIRSPFFGWVKYAAAILVLVGIGFLYQNGYFSSPSDTVLVPKDELITLELDNGKTQTIDLSQTKEVKDSKGNLIGNQKKTLLSYTKETSAEQLVYNTLKVPYGKRFRLELSDGTTAHLNSGTTLRFPVAFLRNGNRQVYLKGEAYFDVSEDKTRPFIVKAKGLNVEVLGTKFNASSYSEDKATDVVLVEGSVNLSIDGAPQTIPVTLSPGQKGTLGRDAEKISVRKVNTTIYTAWMEGRLVFRNMAFDDILKNLERHYNIEIENANAELGKDLFDASFDKIKIDSVLSFFNDTHKINYTIENNKVFIR